MPRLMTAALMAGLGSALFFGFAQQPTATPTTSIKMVPIEPTSPASGEKMYATYCAVCHGANGTGNGPAAAALKTPPTDLTALSRKNGGAFPADHIYSILKFGQKEAAHGSSEMPIWGDLMLTLDRNSPDSNVVLHERIVNLTSYLKQIQK